MPFLRMSLYADTEICTIMKICGITGGVGCGKTTVLTLIKKLTDSYIIMADDVAKSMYEAGSPITARIRDEFGAACIDADGSVNKKALADAIYSDESRRMRLNEIVHPEVTKAILEEIGTVREKGGYDYIFVEAALFFEAGFEKFCDEVWFIYADLAVRRERLKSERGYSDERIDKILASQMTEKEFISRCDKVIDNSGTLSETERILVNML